ncbi:hypothetical protein [Hymenobacter coccineus]|uniref:Uncharacterized protein n=1 Tax=Hymenobacter coccineus TaxID=1908235 RepID=A0A1G1TIT4_9BACT|nr:hypothetical protein [Hymenobacter coccineus]OGX90783.1 hypothetical protein BEN49_00350 [Hymenobacter coccineus]
MDYNELSGRIEALLADILHRMDRHTEQQGTRTDKQRAQMRYSPSSLPMEHVSSGWKRLFLIRPARFLALEKLMNPGLVVTEPGFLLSPLTIATHC